MKTYIVAGHITFAYRFEIEAEDEAEAGSMADERASNALDTNDSCYLIESHHPDHNHTQEIYMEEEEEEEAPSEEEDEEEEGSEEESEEED